MTVRVSRLKISAHASTAAVFNHPPTGRQDVLWGGLINACCDSVGAQMAARDWTSLCGPQRSHRVDVLEDLDLPNFPDVAVGLRTIQPHCSVFNNH